MPAIQNNKGILDWLGGVGSADKGDRVSLNHVAQSLVELGEFLIVEARHNLNKGGNVASGQTSKSMNIENLQTNATKMSLDVVIDSNYKFLDQGVKGVESGAGKFKFRTKYPNKKMALALLKWVKIRRIVSKYKAISKTEAKNKGIKALSDSATSQKSLAYAIATNIKKHGIKATGFFTKAIVATKKEQKKRFANAFKLDIIENLRN